MKVTAPSQELLKALNTVSKAIGMRSTMPILECVYIQAKDNILFFKGSDSEMSIITSMPAQVNTQGEIVVNIRTISDIVRTYPSGEVEITVNDKNVINIRCANSDVNILGRNANEYPKFDMINMDNFIKIKNDTFKSMIKETIFASASQDIASPVMTGMLAEIKDGYMRFAAIDGYKLAVRNEKIESDGRIRCIVPSKTMSEIYKILSMYAYDALVHISENKFVVNIGDTQIISNLLNGEFINYESMIPKEVKLVVKLDTRELQNSVERASLITDEAKNSLIKMDFIDDLLTITSESDIGKVVEEINLNKSGEDLKIAFNSKFILEILKNISDERIVFELVSRTSPALIKPVDSDKFIYLVMPVMYVE